MDNYYGRSDKIYNVNDRSRSSGDKTSTLYNYMSSAEGLLFCVDNSAQKLIDPYVIMCRQVYSAPTFPPFWCFIMYKICY